MPPKKKDSRTSIPRRQPAVEAADEHRHKVTSGKDQVDSVSPLPVTDQDMEHPSDVVEDAVEDAEATEAELPVEPTETEVDQNDINDSLSGDPDADPNADGTGVVLDEDAAPSDSPAEVAPVETPSVAEDDEISAVPEETAEETTIDSEDSVPIDCNNEPCEEQLPLEADPTESELNATDQENTTGVDEEGTETNAIEATETTETTETTTPTDDVVKTPSLSRSKSPPPSNKPRQETQPTRPTANAVSDSPSRSKSPPLSDKPRPKQQAQPTRPTANAVSEPAPRRRIPRLSDRPAQKITKQDTAATASLTSSSTNRSAKSFTIVLKDGRSMHVNDQPKDNGEYRYTHSAPFDRRESRRWGRHEYSRFGPPARDSNRTKYSVTVPTPPSEIERERYQPPQGNSFPSKAPASDKPTSAQRRRSRSRNRSPSGPSRTSRHRSPSRSRSRSRDRRRRRHSSRSSSRSPSKTDGLSKSELARLAKIGKDIDDKMRNGLQILIAPKGYRLPSMLTPESSNLLPPQSAMSNITPSSQPNTQSDHSHRAHFHSHPNSNAAYAHHGTNYSYALLPPPRYAPPSHIPPAHVSMHQTEATEARSGNNFPLSNGAPPSGNYPSSSVRSGMDTSSNTVSSNTSG